MTALNLSHTLTLSEPLTITSVLSRTSVNIYFLILEMLSLHYCMDVIYISLHDSVLPVVES